jgi:hypothetical protein
VVKQVGVWETNILGFERKSSYNATSNLASGACTSIGNSSY